MVRKVNYSAIVGLIVLAAVLCNTASAGLVAHWKFDESSGTTAKDATSNKNDGTVVGNAKWVTGKIGGAFEFDGSTYINCGNKASINLRDQITMSFWFKVKAFSNTWETFLAKGDGAYRSARSGGTGNATHMGITGSNYFDGVTVVTDDQWHHWAGTYDGTTATIYVDGIPDASRTYSGQIGDSSSYNLYIGENQQATGRFLHGLLDDVRLYDRALSEQQLQDLIVNGTEPSWNKAEKPEPADGATGVLIAVLRWSKGDATVFHNVYVGTMPDMSDAKRMARLPAANATYFYLGTTPGATYYWRVDEEAKDKTIYPGDVWKFTMAPLAAFGPVPRNGDKWIDPDVDPTWEPGADAQAHDVYFSTDESLVAARDASVKVGDMQVLPILELPTLEAGTTYYWLVDEFDSLDETHEGEVWSFTTMVPGTGGVKAEYFRNMTVTGAPFLTQIEPSIDHSWGDPGGPAAGVDDNFSARWTADLEIAIADAYTFIGTSDDGIRVWLNDDMIVDSWVDRSTADSFSAAQQLDPGVYSLRVEYYENTGGAVAQLSWQTPNMARQIIPAGPLQPPVRAKPINPQDNDVNVPQDVILMWSAGQSAVTHDVYFGEDEAAVAAATPADAGIYKGSQALEINTWSPGALEWNKTYYWRVDEVNTASPDSPWQGAVWSFTTADFLVIDNFESYTDEVTGRIFQTWIDGWGYTEPAPGDPGNGTGSTVGYATEPFAEHSIVHTGGSSMPFAYNNADSPFYSETERTFDSPQNWTVNGVDTLSLYVRGYPQVNDISVTETGGKMTLTGDGADIWNASDDFTFAYKTLNGDATIVAKVTSVGTGTNTWAKGGVMIRDSLDGGAVDAYMVMTGSAGNGASFAYRSTADTDYAANTDSTVIVAPPYWVKLERIADTFTSYYSPDGSAWTMVDSAEVIMSGTACIGICVTSHQSGEQRTFQFESIKTTGSVTGQWQGAVISSPKYNSAQDLYVAIQDSSNKIAVVTDATAVNATTWTEVRMPLSSFTGVNMTKVKMMFIGVGNRNSPMADGSGMLFIDDIRVIRP
ncbi:MAG: hypothetical protein JW955_19310 [Sedimentisphaerales bacterium]|nr:hypothetical protein [Sedimentisphaerales bacterium]